MFASMSTDESMRAPMLHEMRHVVNIIFLLKFSERVGWRGGIGARMQYACDKSFHPSFMSLC